jgi:hypothetical protein
MKSGVHECGCGRCREGGPNSTRELHAELNAFLSTLDEEKRTQFLGLESMNASYGGGQQLELIAGVKAVEIARTRWGIQQVRLRRPAYILESERNSKTAIRERRPVNALDPGADLPGDALLGQRERPFQAVLLN